MVPRGALCVGHKSERGTAIPTLGVRARGAGRVCGTATCRKGRADPRVLRRRTGRRGALTGEAGGAGVCEKRALGFSWRLCGAMLAVLVPEELG